MSGDEYLNKLVIAKTSQGEVQFVGHCIGYTDSPTVTVNLADGTQAHWRADMCRVLDVTDEEMRHFENLFRRRDSQ